MKVLIIGFAKIKYMPYLDLYLDNIDAQKNDVHLLYWDRDGESDKHVSPCVKCHVFSKHMADEIPKLKKLSSFFAFTKQTRKLIKEENFDFIISLTSIPTVLLSQVLLKKYKEKYIFDYRDYTFEHFKPYRKLIAKLVENSALTVYSSEKHRRFLPESPKLHLAHNFTKLSLSFRNVGLKEKRKENEPIRLSYWGIIRNESFNKKVIEKLANDKRFEITFYGRKQQTANNLEKYCVENNVKNIRFAGEYQQEERYVFAARTDLLYNLYDISGTEGMAMGNKFYDGIIFGIPQICTAGSFMGEMAEKNQVGKAVALDSDDIGNDIYNYYHDLDMCVFREKCDSFVNTVENDYQTLSGGIKALFI